MNKFFFKGVLPTAALALFLTACGGGDEGALFVQDRDPTGSGLPATMTVSAATTPALNGPYTTTNIFLNNVTKVDPVGEEVETCRMRFNNLTSTTNAQQLMDGDIRYLPGTNALRTADISVNGINFAITGTTGVSVDRANNRVVFTGAVLNSTQPTGQSVTLTGAIPMRGDRPEGC